MITFNLAGKRAIVTGAASGIGLATAKLLAQSGASVALLDLPGNPRLNTEVDNLNHRGFHVLAAPCDVSDVNSVNSTFKSIISELDGIDYLINNAGTPGTRTPLAPDDFPAQDENFWNTLLSVNLQGPARCTAAAVAALRLSGGSIKEYARALGPDIRVNAIAPGIVDSPWECRFDIPEETLEKLPLQRRGLPEDFAEAIVFLLAGGSYITGHTLVLDGGLLSGSRT